LAPISIKPIFPFAILAAQAAILAALVPVASNIPVFCSFYARIRGGMFPARLYGQANIIGDFSQC